MKYTNQTNIPLPLAVWLAHDPYDYNPDPNTISATSLLKPIRSLVLSGRVPPAHLPDLSSNIASRLGQAIHDSVEQTWSDPEVRKACMQAIGVSDNLIDKVAFNEIEPDVTDLPVYAEQRLHREIDGITISGKPDFILDGSLIDFKSTKTYEWVKGLSKDKYIQQGSIYRWLAPELITDDVMSIHFIFMDWMAGKAKFERNYPPHQLMSLELPLMSLKETEAFIKDKVGHYLRYVNVSNESLPLCNKEDLWQEDTLWKYYKNPSKLNRSTKNFDNPFDAQNRLQKEGGMGVVIEVPGKAKRCKYCPAVTICTQAEDMIESGLLDL